MRFEIVDLDRGLGLFVVGLEEMEAVCIPVVGFVEALVFMGTEDCFSTTRLG